MITELNRFIQSNNINVELISKRKNEAKSLIKEGYRGVFYNKVEIIDLKDLETKKGSLIKVIFNSSNCGFINYEEVIA